MNGIVLDYLTNGFFAIILVVLFNVENLVVNQIIYQRYFSLVTIFCIMSICITVPNRKYFFSILLRAFVKYVSANLLIKVNLQSGMSPALLNKNRNVSPGFYCNLTHTIMNLL